jgi:hypothetical protein
MRDVERFDLFFGRIENGWLPVCVVIDNERFEVRASSVLNDPVFELAEAAEALAGSDAVRSEVQLWLEPETLNILFASALESTVVRLTIRASGYIRDEHAVPINEYVLDRDAVAVSLVNALNSLRGQFHGDTPLHGWGRFPMSILRGALQRLAKKPHLQREVSATEEGSVSDATDNASGLLFTVERGIEVGFFFDNAETRAAVEMLRCAIDTPTDVKAVRAATAEAELIAAATSSPIDHRRQRAP